MKLYEYMAKGVLAEAGVPIPRGRLCRTPEEAGAACRDLGPVAVKAQVLVGGRGKAGGIKVADTPEEAEAAARQILGMNLKGYTVDTVYCESKLSITQEIYLSLTFDPGSKRPLLIASASGGIAIEEVPEKAIIKRGIPVAWGLQPYMAYQVARRLGLGGVLAREFSDLACKLYKAFVRLDAELVEINPLAVVDGHIIAADSRLNVDDDAMARHGDLPTTSEATPLESKVRALGLAFVQLDGDIAVMANGAGITMATLDVLQHYGGKPMNFLDAGGGSSAGPTAEALAILFNTHPKAVLVNIFGGITRCDEVAKAIVQVRREQAAAKDAPLVVRLVGTNETEGHRILREAGVDAFRSMQQAAERVVALAGEGVGAV
ncbi:MAG TPA: ADP-forming succinate--CoA ligase subunit beta [Bacillota bacterium]|nr:ADP-forming succinate--CoA ligase subunit beta [Bacillota bacterium]